MAPAAIAALLAQYPARKIMDKTTGQWAGRIMTMPFRIQYPEMAAPVKGKDSEGPPKYSCMAIFHPSSDLAALRSIADAERLAKFPNPAVHSTLKYPLREQAIKAHLGEKCGFANDGFFATFGANVGYVPAIMDAAGKRLPQETPIQPGDWYIASIHAYSYGTKAGSKNRGVGFNLGGIQKVASDTRLERGSASAADDFGPVAMANGGQPVESVPGW